MMAKSAYPEERYTALGKIGAAVGIKGWVRLISYTEPADNILGYRHFTLAFPQNMGRRQPESAPTLIEIDESRLQGKHFIGHVKGCDDRELARQFTGCELLIEKAALPDLDEGYYWYQLERLTVINDQGDNLGTVDHLMETGANDVLVVRATEESIDEEERLIPYLRDQVIKEVDLESSVIRVDWEKDY